MSADLEGHEKPVNKMAAMSFAKGVVFKSQWKIKPFSILYKNKPATIPFPGQKEHDLTGVKYSRLTVIGYIRSKKQKSGGAIWLVRCVCGQYEERVSKGIKNHDPKKVYRCSVCERFAVSKRCQEYTKLGYNLYDDIGKY